MLDALQLPMREDALDRILDEQIARIVSTLFNLRVSHTQIDLHVHACSGIFVRQHAFNGGTA